MSPAAMREIGEILDLTPAEILSTASFYTMYKRGPVGRYLISVCTNITCLWLGGEELFEHISERLGIGNSQTTDDGLFTLEEMQCAAACGGAPCLQVNYLFAENVTLEQADEMIDDLRAGRQPRILLDPIPVGSHPGEAELPRPGAPGSYSALRGV